MRELSELLEETRRWMNQAMGAYLAERQLASTGKATLVHRPLIELGPTRDLARAWMAVYPAQVPFQDRLAPAAVLPDNVRTLTLDLPLKTRQGRTVTLAYGWLDHLVERTLAAGEHTMETAGWRELVVWGTLSGLNPNRFNGAVTPINRLAQGGRVDVLSLLKDAGADLVMALDASHVAKGPGGRVGSTLLHRLVQQAGQASSAEDHDRLLRSITFLAEQVPGSMTPDATGWDPVTHAVGQVRTVLLRVEAAPRIAKRETVLAAHSPAAARTRPRA